MDVPERSILTNETDYTMYPFVFEPIFKRYIWGGRKLGSALSKPIGAGDDYAESWELVDHESDQSTLSNGPLAGTSLNELVERHGRELLGETWYKRINRSDVPESLKGRFPLLLKFLDANRDLSVQVHPDDSMGRTLEPPDLGKTEAWFVVDAEPGSKIFCGLNRSTTRQQLSQAIKEGKTEQLLNVIQPKTGDCIFVPAGTVHAIGAGLLIAEIQQASNTTFRLFDWNRVDHLGNSRQLHIPESLAACDFERGPVYPVESVEHDGESRQPLVACENFEIDRLRIARSSSIGGDGRMRLLMMIDGTIEIELASAKTTFENLQLRRGNCSLIPASCEPVQLKPGDKTTMLEIRLPE